MQDWRDQIKALIEKEPLQHSIKSLSLKFNQPYEKTRNIFRRDGYRHLKDMLINENDRLVVDSTSQEVQMAKKLKPEQVHEIVHAEHQALKSKEQQTLTERKYKALQKNHVRLEREYNALAEHMGRDIKAKPIKLVPKKSRNQAVPLLVLSDWHVEEEVKPFTIGGKNKYNLEIAAKRVDRVFNSAVKLIKEKEGNVEVNTIAVFLLGDFITGNIHDENVENALLLPLDALAYAEKLIQGGLDFLLEQTDKNLVIYCKVGNHSRITRRVHASTEWENSLEMAMYWSLMQKYQDNPRVEFHLEKSYLSIVSILGHKVRFHHGHAVNYGGGVGGLHIPLRKAISNWNANEKAVVDIMGHYHNFTEFTTLKYMVNGSLIGYSAYAERIKAILEPPIQGFAWIHAKYGFTEPTPIFAE